MVTSVEVADRMVKMTDINTMMDISVPLPPPDLNDRMRIRRLWWSLPLLTIGLFVSLAIITASLTPLRLWQLAPGSVQGVADRLTFDDQAREVASI